MQWLLSLHIIFMVSWFAGLFYLPRFFVYHAGFSEGAVHEQFCLMEYKLYRFTMMAMFLALGFGIWLAVLEWSVLQDTVWFYIKVSLVAVLVGYHFYCGYLLRVFRASRNERSHVFYRWYNEVPAILLMVIVVLVIIKPI